MTFFHAWVHIENYQNHYNRNDLFNLQKKLGVTIGFELKTIFNGTEFITITGNTNHFSSAAESTISFFKSLTQYIHEESYGILYIWDDEDSKQYDKFQVWKLKNGKVESCEDTVLSPMGF